MYGPVRAFFGSNQRQLDELYRLKRLLSGPPNFLPFTFYLPSRTVHAPNSGIEGFSNALLDLEGYPGIPALVPHLHDCLRYLADLFIAADESPDFLHELASQAPSESSYIRLRTFLDTVLTATRNKVDELDSAAWIRSAAIYQLYPRAYNLKGLRAVRAGPVPKTGRLFADIALSDLPGPFDAIRWTGVYPVGTLDKKGIGSPFAIADHSVIDPLWGNKDEIRAKVQALAASGTRAISELSPNHTAVDAVLLQKSPQCYIHTTTEPADATGYYKFFHRATRKTYWIRRGAYLYDGTRYYWNDTLQLDISQPQTLLALANAVKALVRDYGISGFRVDMAYQLLNGPFAYNWGKEMQHPLGKSVEDEFFFKLIRNIKVEFPHVGFIAEGFFSWERLSEVGFDVIYSKNEMTLEGGFHHTGWFNALASRDVAQMRAALRRASFLIWQKGGSGMLAFVGHHDLPSPVRTFGSEWVYGATLLTLLLPVARNWYAGTEAGFEAVCDENQKMITFAEDVAIDWSGLSASFGTFVCEILRHNQTIRTLLGPAPHLRPLFPNDGSPWVGYVLSPQKGQSDVRAVVIANPANHSTWVNLEFDGSAFNAELRPCGYLLLLQQERKWSTLIN